MSALGAIEQVHLLLLLRSGSAHVALVGVRLGVHNAGRLAESRDADTMPETDLRVVVLGLSGHRGVDDVLAYEEGAGGGDEDVAAGSSLAGAIVVGCLRVVLTRIPGGWMR